MNTTLPASIALISTVAVEYKYLIVVLGTFFEGPIVMIIGGFLLRTGFFELWPLYTALVVGDIIADIGWYCIGRFFAGPFIRKHGHFLSVTPAVVTRVDSLFQKYHNRLLIISKLTMGFGFAIAVLLVAGATKVPFRTYLVINVLGEFIFAAMLMAVGYFFGHLYTLIADGFKVGFIIGLSLFVGAVIYGLVKYMKKRVFGV